MNPWRIPTFYAAGSLVAALVLPRIEQVLLPGLSHGMSVATATAFLSATASGIITFAAIVISFAFVIIQFSAIAYSPRLALWFVNRPQLYHTLGVFIATFTFTMTTLAWVDRNGSGTVPFLPTLIVLVLLAASMVIFANLVRGVAQLQITGVLSLLGDLGRKVVAKQEGLSMWPGVMRLPLQGYGLPATDRQAQKLLHSGPPRSVRTIDAPHLVALATQYDCLIHLKRAVGDTVLHGDCLVVVEGAAKQIPPQDLRVALHLGRDRTLEQDPKFVIRLLVDIAIKALSPAINDPTTAVQALDQIEDLLRRLGQQELGSVWLGSADGRRRVFVQMPSWDDYLHLAFDEIRQCGVTSIQVMQRLATLLDSLSSVVADPDRHAAVEVVRQLLDKTGRAQDFKGADGETAQQADRQGAGLTLVASNQID